MTRVQSVARAISLLGEVAHRPAGLVGLAAAVDLPTTTTARLLATLESVDAVRRNDAGVYRIGPAIASLAASTDFDTSLVRLAQPHMVDLVAIVDEAIGLAIPAGKDTVTIAQTDAPRPVQAQDWTGSRWPLHAGCSGVAILATWSDDEVDRVLTGDLVALTEATETDPGRVRERIARARRDGIAWSRGEYVDDLSSAAVAITDDTGRGLAALYAYGPSYRFGGPDGRATVEAALMDRAARISRDWTGRVAGVEPRPGGSAPVGRDERPPRRIRTTRAAQGARSA